MKTKHNLISEIFSNISGYKFKVSNDKVISFACKYNDYDKILDVHNDVRRGLIAPEVAISFLTGYEPIENVVYI